MKHKLISIALITVLLFMVLGNGIGCTGAGNPTLTITSTAGGDVTTPAEGTYTYAAGTVVNLTATADSGYQFVNWTATAGTFGSATAATTNYTMPSQNATVTAHFALNATMNFIANVPDTNVPPTSNTPNCCAPIAMVNILGYWDEVKGLANAYNVTAFQVPSNLNTVADYVRYFMDTNNIAPAARGNPVDGHFGTYAKDITPGNLDYVRWDNAHNFTTPPPVRPAGKVGHDWGGAADYATGFPIIKAEIDAGQPLVVCYRWWTLVFCTNVTDPQSGKVISVYTPGPQTGNSTNPPEEWNGYSGEYCIGHAVTCVGYILNWNPLGGAALNWTIVHDTWATTPENIAVPWTGAPWWNSSHTVLP